MLLAFAKKLRADIKQLGTTELPIGTLTVISPYPQLRYGDVDGIGLVEIDATGNMHGMSPVERCQDQQGETAWIPTELVRNIRLQPFGYPSGTATRGRSSTTEGTTTPKSHHRSKKVTPAA